VSGGDIGRSSARYRCRLRCRPVDDRGRQRQRADFQGRIDGPATGYWGVVIDNVSVGVLSDPQYATLEEAVFENPRLYVAQAWNVVTVGMRVGAALLVLGSVGIFVLGIAAAAFDPARAATVVAIAHATPLTENLAVVSHGIARITPFIALPICLLGLLGAPRFGYENKFQVELGAAVRRRLSVPAGGQMMLVPAPALRSA
jgi:hypothetical protein